MFARVNVCLWKGGCALSFPLLFFMGLLALHPLLLESTTGRFWPISSRAASSILELLFWRAQGEGPFSWHKTKLL